LHNKGLPKWEDLHMRLQKLRKNLGNLGGKDYWSRNVLGLLKYISTENKTLRVRHCEVPKGPWQSSKYSARAKLARFLTGLPHPRFARVRNDGLFKRYISYLFLIFTYILLSISPLQAASHLPSNVLLRDAEIEQVLKDYLTPLFKVAGLNPS